MNPLTMSGRRPVRGTVALGIFVALCLPESTGGQTRLCSAGATTGVNGAGEACGTCTRTATSSGSIYSCSDRGLTHVNTIEASATGQVPTFVAGTVNM